MINSYENLSPATLRAMAQTNEGKQNLALRFQLMIEDGMLPETVEMIETALRMAIEFAQMKEALSDTDNNLREADRACIAAGISW